MKNYKRILAGLLAEKTGLDAGELQGYMEVPPQPELGDFAFPCFRLAKSLRKAPNLIAADLAVACAELPAEFERVVQTGAYLNFFLSRRTLAEDCLTELLDPSIEPGRSDEGGGRTVLVEYSSPNIAKPFHVGHAFSTVVGEALKRIYEHLGYRALGLNHLGDYGTQFGKLIVAYERWGDGKALEADAIKELLRIYVKFHHEAENETGLIDEARDRFRRLEQGGERETALWTLFRESSLKEFKRVYDRLGVHFDSFDGESFFSDKIPEVVEILRDKGLLEESEGAQVVRLDDEKMPPCIILKSDGTTIYASRDLAAILYRKRHYDFDRNIYVVGLPQTLHFRQVFSVWKRAGFDYADDCKHVGFGTVKLPGGTMSTRGGQVVLLEDLLNEAVAKTAEIIRRNAVERGQEMNENEVREIAEAVGVSAVQYAFLRNGRERDIIFTWEDMLDFDGDTAPYLQYTYARARSVLRRSGLEAEALRTSDFGCCDSDAEFALLQAMADFGPAVHQAAEAYEPSVLARQLQLIARLFNKFYSACPILNQADEDVRRARLALCAALCRVLDCGLGLLGLRAVERM